MGNRRRSRELAMQALFYMDIRKIASDAVLDSFCRAFRTSNKEDAFFTELVTGVIGSKADIDALIERFSSHWKISRMSCVDRNAMRIAVYEMLYRADIPSKVSINEAIDVGKKYGTEESGGFINGILDSIHLAIKNREIQIPGARGRDESRNKNNLEKELAG